MNAIAVSHEMIERAARIIDQNAFSPRMLDNERKTRRQRIARRKAADILDGKAGNRVAPPAELVDALADAHRQLKALIEIMDTLDHNFHRQLDPAMTHWANLLTRHGRPIE